MIPPLEFFAVSGVLAWCWLIWRSIHAMKGLGRRLRWALNPRGRTVAHKSGRPYARDAAFGSWNGHSASRWPAVHVDKSTGEIWEA